MVALKKMLWFDGSSVTAVRGSVVNNGKKSYEVHSLKRAVSRLSTSRDFFLGQFCSKFNGSAKYPKPVSQFHFSSKRPKNFTLLMFLRRYKANYILAGFAAVAQKKLVVTKLPHIVPAKIAWSESVLLRVKFYI